jgi:hypothetical protein
MDYVMLALWLVAVWALACYPIIRLPSLPYPVKRMLANRRRNATYLAEYDAIADRI